MSSDHIGLHTQILTAVRIKNLRKVKELVGSYGLFFPSQGNGYVLLRTAIKFNSVKIAKYLLTLDCNVNSKRSKIKPTKTPLHYAVSYLNTELVEMLLNKGANIDAVDERGQTPLYLAINYHQEKIVEILLRRGSYIHKTCRGNTYLIAAIMKSEPNVNIVELLISYGASVNIVPTSSSFENNIPVPLLLALKTKKEEIVRLLLSRGADINVKGEYGETPLHIAAEKGLLQTVKYFLNHGFSVNCYTPPSYSSTTSSCPTSVKKDGSSGTGYTPLHLATVNGKDRVVKYLLDSGANVDAQDKDGKTALHIAVEEGNNAITKLILSYHPDINNTGNTNVLVDAVVLTPRDSTVLQSLRDYGFSIDAHYKSNVMLLNAAVEKGYLDVLDDLIRLGADVNTIVKKCNGFSMLHVAVKNKNKKVCQWLLSNKADVNIKDSTNKCSISYAIENGDLCITKLLLSYGANLNDSGNVIEAFNTAVEKEYLEVVELILQHDECFNINTADRSGKTPLYCMASSRNYDLTVRSSAGNSFKRCDNDSIKASIAKLLLNKGADVNIRTKEGFTTLFAAAKNGYKKVVETLLEYNVDVHAVQDDGRCALYVAASRAHPEVVEILLKAGCDINVRVECNNTGYWYTTSHESNTSLHIAAKNGFINIVELLLKYHANVLLKNKHDQTALHLACKNGHQNVVEFLVNVGANVNAVDICGVTALHIAAEHGFLNTVELLLKYHANVQLKNRHDKTALHFACKRGHKKVVKILLNVGADVNASDRSGLTPLHNASENGHLNCINILFKYGSDINSTTKIERLTPLNCAELGQSNWFMREVYDRNDNIEENFERIIRKLTEHIIKLKTANLYVLHSNLQTVYNVDSDDENSRWVYDEYDLFHEGCLDELNIMKSHSIVNGITFYDIVTKSIDQLAVYARNQLLVQSLNSFDSEKMFPIYSDIISGRFKIAIKRKVLFEECGRLLFSGVSNDLSRLPYICISKILSNLSDDHLKNVLVACTPSN